MKGNENIAIEDRDPQKAVTRDTAVEETEKAPLLGQWKYWYWLVTGVLLLFIALFYSFTKYFS